jgi:hypothetical protein
MTVPSLVILPFSKALNPSPSYLAIQFGITSQTRCQQTHTHHYFTTIYIYLFLPNSAPIDAHSKLILGCPDFLCPIDAEAYKSYPGATKYANPGLV